MSTFKKATRSGNKLKLSITGPSGSGKTLSALLIAKGIGGKIALIDSENGSASLYADQEGIPPFDALDLSPPYTTQKYVDAIRLAINEKYNIVIVDSGTHQWAGEGGILSQKEKMDQRPGSNSFTNWGKLTPEQEFFKSTILHADIHLIMTLRSKQEYALVQEPGQKAKVQKLGMAPVQREGMEYEFTTVFDVDMSHNASVSKDRSGLFDGKYFKITEDTGRELKAWLGSETKSENIPKSDLAATPALDEHRATVEAKKLEFIRDSKIAIPGAFYGRSISSLNEQACKAVITSFEAEYKNNKEKCSGIEYKETITRVRERLKEFETAKSAFGSFSEPSSVIVPRAQ